MNCACIQVLVKLCKRDHGAFFFSLSFLTIKPNNRMSLRRFFTDLRFERSHGVLKVRSVPPGGAEAPHSGVRGPVVWLHGAFGADVLPSAGRARITKSFILFIYFFSISLCLGGGIV